MGKDTVKPAVVISAVNFVEGGALTILKDSISAYINNYIHKYPLVLLVNNKQLIEEFKKENVEVIEYAYPKKSWLLRIWFEYVHCWFISKKIKPYLWLALHDMTPNVVCRNKIVYCHNPATFYNLSLKEAWMEKSLIFFRFFYIFFFRFNIRSNKYVIVQQQWLRDEFKERFKVKNVIVAYPDVNMSFNVNVTKNENNKFCFFYPAFPRVFKNFEVLLDAAEQLQKKNDFEVWLTIDGTENKYSNYLFKKYHHCSCIKFLGLQTREQMRELYSKSSCLVFPSKLETWGLPITEMKLYNKPILVADCRYANETVGNYNKASFFDPNNADKLCSLMQSAVDGSLKFNKTFFQQPDPPFTHNWNELFSLILSE